MLNQLTDELEVGSVETKAAKDRPPSAFQSLAVKAISARALLQLPPTPDFCGSLVKIRAGFPKQQNKTNQQQKPLCPRGYIPHCIFWTLLPVTMT